MNTELLQDQADLYNSIYMSPNFDAHKEVQMDEVKKYTSQDLDLKDEVNYDRLFGKSLPDTFDV